VVSEGDLKEYGEALKVVEGMVRRGEVEGVKAGSDSDSSSDSSSEDSDSSSSEDSTDSSSACSDSDDSKSSDTEIVERASASSTALREAIEQVITDIQLKSPDLHNWWK